MADDRGGGFVCNVNVGASGVGNSLDPAISRAYHGLRDAYRDFCFRHWNESDCEQAIGREKQQNRCYLLSDLADVCGRDVGILVYNHSLWMK